MPKKKKPKVIKMPAIDLTGKDDKEKYEKELKRWRRDQARKHDRRKGSPGHRYYHWPLIGT